MYQRHDSSEELIMKSQAAVENMFRTFLRIPDGPGICIEYLNTKVNLLFSAHRSSGNLEFVKTWYRYLKTTKEKLKQLKERELKSNGEAFSKMLNDFFKVAENIAIPLKESGMDNIIRQDEELVIETFKKSGKSAEDLKGCLDECESLKMLLKIIVNYLKTCSEVSFPDAPIIESKLFEMSAILVAEEQKQKNVVRQKRPLESDNE